MTRRFLVLGVMLTGCASGSDDVSGDAPFRRQAAHPGPELTRMDGRFLLGGRPIAPFGLRAINALQTDAITDALIGALPALRAHGMQSVVVGLQGGRHTSGGNSAYNGFTPGGGLDIPIASRLARVLDEAAAESVVVVLNLFYRGRDQELRDDAAVRAALRNALEFVRPWRHVWVLALNEPGHPGYDRAILKDPRGHEELFVLAAQTDPGRIVYVSHHAGATPGFVADTWGRLRRTTPPAGGDLSVEYVRGDSYEAPGEFTEGYRAQAYRDARAAALGGGYWFWHASWHQRADAPGWPRFLPGGAGSAAEPGVAFIWDGMWRLADSLTLREDGVEPRRGAAAPG